MGHDNGGYVSTGNYEQALYTVLRWPCGCVQRFGVVAGKYQQVDVIPCKPWVNETTCVCQSTEGKGNVEH